MRTQLIPASNGSNPEREGGVEHVGGKSSVVESHRLRELLAQDVQG
jgi:hypothetical protein